MCDWRKYGGPEGWKVAEADYMAPSTYRRIISQGSPVPGRRPLRSKRHADPRRLVHSTPSHPWPHYFEPSTRIPEAPVRVLWALWHAETPIDEVEALTVGMSNRNRDMALARLGVSGHPPPTYATIAREVGISRARVGQLINRFTDELTSWGIRLPWCEHLLDCIQMRNGVWHSSEADERLTNSLDALVGLSELGLMSSRLEWDTNTASWTTGQGLRNMARYKTQLADDSAAIKKQRRHWGAFRLNLLPHSSIIPKQVAIGLATPATVAGCNVDNRLIVFPDARSVLATTARKALTALRSLAIADLHNGISQHHRLKPPSLAETHDILSVHRDFAVDRNRNVTLAERPDPSSVLTVAERTALQIMKDAEGVIDNDGYLYRMEKAGFGRELAGAVLRAPFVRRLDRAVYALRGREIGPGRIQTAKAARLNRFRNSLVRSERDSCRVTCSYHLSRPCLSEGRLPLPAADAIGHGKWRTTFPDGTNGTLLVRESSIRGLRPWMRRAGLAVGSRVSLDVDKNTRHIRVTQTD